METEGWTESLSRPGGWDKDLFASASPTTPHAGPHHHYGTDTTSNTYTEVDACKVVCMWAHAHTHTHTYTHREGWAVCVKRRCVTKRTKDGLSDRVQVERGEQKLQLSSRVLFSSTPLHARTLHTLLRKLLVCWAKASHPSSPFLPSAQWGSQSNLFLMGKHRHEYVRTHALTHTLSHTHTHRYPRSRGTQHPVLTSPQDTQAHSGSHYHRRTPKSPHLHHALEFHRHTQAPLPQTLASYSPITATHHGLPRGHPLPHPRTHWCARTQESQSHTQTLIHMLNQNSSGLTYGYQHTLRTVTLAHRYCSTSRNSDSTAPTPITLSPNTSTPSSEKHTHTHPE